MKKLVYGAFARALVAVLLVSWTLHEVVVLLAPVIVPLTVLAIIAAVGLAVIRRV